MFKWKTESGAEYEFDEKTGIANRNGTLFCQGIHEFGSCEIIPLLYPPIGRGIVRVKVGDIIVGNMVYFLHEQGLGHTTKVVETEAMNGLKLIE